MRLPPRGITARLASLAVPPDPDWTEFRRQEVALIALNVTALLGVIILPVLLSGDLGPLKPIVILVGLARVLVQLAELVWYLSLRSAPSERFKSAAVHVSIWINVAFAWLVAMLSLSPATHFVVLMLIPLIAAAFRVSLPEMMAVLLSALALTFVEIYLTFHASPTERFEEFFHGATVAAMFVIVAVMVRLLAAHLRRSEQRQRSAIAELERTKDRLVAEEYLASIGRLSSSIAHEIRNPVAMIASSAAMVKEGGMPRDEFMEIVQRESARLVKLTGDFLSYARPKAPERKLTSMVDSLDYIRSLTAARAASAGVTVETHCNSDLQANVDAYQVHQALLNLVMNAIDATPPGGTVEIGARAGSGNATVFWVENSGEPISRDAMSSRIFEPFYTTKRGGTGLGLAIARNIVKSHGGLLVLGRNDPGHVRFEAAIPNEARE